MTLNALGSKSAVDTILQCFRNNVFLNTEDTYTAREAVIGPARVFLKPYWKERGVSYFEEEGG